MSDVWKRLEALTERVLARDVDYLADVCDRVALFKHFVCKECGCAPKREHFDRCDDCSRVLYLLNGYDEPTPDDAVAACVSKGMRALCGRKIMAGIGGTGPS